MLLFRTDRGRLPAIAFLFLLLAGWVKVGAEELPMRPASAATYSARFVTNISQFGTLSPTDFLMGCDFHLTGLVTLVDTNRELVVLQDASGAVALNFRCGCSDLKVGESVALDGTNACPLFSSFPDYPFRPSGHDICRSFETPSDWGEYNLTRMRGYLHPQVSGNYRFWIASDNSSELWLSTDANAWNARRIAFIPRFGWTDRHKWNVFTSQHSDVIQLKAGETYYIEALQEQTAEAENLSVGWQEPEPGEPAITVIPGRYLTPWHDRDDQPDSVTNGILREYWTNYPAGDVAGMAGARPFESALTVEKVAVHVQGPGELPTPVPLALNRPWRPEDNYRWVSVEGAVKFLAAEGDAAQLEVSTGRTPIQVRALHWNPDLAKRMQQLTNAFVKAEGVCEGIRDPNGTMVPGLIWATAENRISLVAGTTTNEIPAAESQLVPTDAAGNASLQSYFQTIGVVTFNDRVFDKDLIFIQANNSSVTKVSLEDPFLKQQLAVGRYVEVGGTLGPGKYLQSISPFFVADMGKQAMPLPIASPPGAQAQTNLEGRWCETEGIIRSVNTNGTLSLVGKNGFAYLWLGQASSNYLAHCVDAKLRARGVLILTLLDDPLLLVPSPDFIDVEEQAPEDPFNTPRWPIASVLAETFEPLHSHRVRIVGQVTYRAAGSFFVQDATGGVRVQCARNCGVGTGDRVEVAAFPPTGDSGRELTEALVRPAALADNITPRNLDLNDASSGQGGTLVQVTAMLLVRKTSGADQMLEMQEKQRIFTATLLPGRGNLPEITPGSQVRVTGIRQDQANTSSDTSEQSMKVQFLPSLNILLRNPEDVEVLGGPPWWTWKKAAALVGLLLVTLVMALLWTHLLRRRLERQRAEQLAFSQHVLGKLEEERRRIASNLHDSLGQTLMVIKHRVISTAESLKGEPAIRGSMDEISTVTSQAIEEVRRIINGLGPHQLDHLGLTRAIRALIDRASENGSIVFASRIENIDGLFEKDAEIHLYRIVQEAVTNILKHSAATEATVVIKKQATTVSISMRDNGKGFDPARSSAQMDDFGYGLSGIAERVRILKGTLALESQPGAGTSVTAEIPFKFPQPISTYETGSNSPNRG